jgi:hypothetical protein
MLLKRNVIVAWISMPPTYNWVNPNYEWDSFEGRNAKGN